MEEPKNLQAIMGLITHSGNAKSCAMEGIQEAKQGNFKAADKKMEEAHNELENAHNSQTSLLSKEASGENIEITLLMVHAQDHLMNAITFCDLAEEFIDLYKDK
ncbi:PTS mannose transporter subunit IIA [Virgibacillus pantothenticus]|uniref:PTS mannose transporter subunit IIA n=2 Tax=Bacillaceae TaxID=186817 RepID=A0A0L0QKS8_VIRPA|nr:MULTISPECIES: PTS lactose/cellobiose transporter subunit IIA [Virgibacillus]API91403.1 PTS lactose/cellobiose transporter subunit IIA [Virgibacillus sp. 6R]KNE19166.1 PTS mannose transporter subunit IIA [Virgibacillus pantothenticus]MEB5451730.1 PTS lactose/cellobiose transporter subunit IIA [Virgibacillus pantothenticus]MEB5455756.1 PTS lactose/cellobiose transporter subunit IIA [Virgibacillus pantothenticus]MEB5461840.1 PTS lactose/cellobiose transporter subunit IIA [Virgibacillus pantoth